MTGLMGTRKVNRCQQNVKHKFGDGSGTWIFLLRWLVGPIFFEPFKDMTDFADELSWACFHGMRGFGQADQGGINLAQLQCLIELLRFGDGGSMVRLACEKHSG